MGAKNVKLFFREPLVARKGVRDKTVGIYDRIYCMKGGDIMISRRYLLRTVAHCSEGCMLLP